MIKKNIVVLLLLLSLFQANRCMLPSGAGSPHAFGETTQNTALCAFAKESFARSFPIPLHEPNPLIRREAEKALHICKISHPVIILQNESSTASAAKTFGSIKIATLLIGVKGGWDKLPLPLIKFYIYHECGHMFYNDLDTKPASDTEELNRERRANQFATEQLIKQHDFLPLVLRFIELTENLFSGRREGERPNHPSWLEQSYAILISLREAHVNLDDLPIRESDLEETCPLARTKKEMQSRFDRSVSQFLSMISHK